MRRDARCRRAGRGGPARVGVLGAGTIGLMGLAVARHGGAGTTVVADLSERRRAVAARLGATETAVELPGEYDVVFEAVGAAAPRRSAVAGFAPRRCRHPARLLGSDAGFDANDLVCAEKRGTGIRSATPDADFRAAADLVPLLDSGWVASRRLDDRPDGFAHLLAGHDDVSKVMLRS